MTVRHAEPHAGRFRLLVLAGVVGPAFFLCCYLLAAADRVEGGVRAAAVGTALDVTAWVGALVLAAADGKSPWAAPRRGPGAALALAPVALLAWMAIDLIHRGDQTGVWAAAPIAATSPLWVLVLGRRAAPPHAPGPEPKAEAAPEPAETGEAPAPESQLPTSAPTLAQAQAPAPTPAPAPPREHARAAPADGDPATQEEPEVVQEGGQADTRPVTRPPARPRQPARRKLAVGLDQDFWEGLKRALERGGREGMEQGGVALTRELDGVPIVVGVVLPKQTSATSVHCEFSVLDVERVRDALDAADPDGVARIRMTWLHTHPGIGVFLSGTDVRTSATWRGFDPGFRPIVVDVTKRELADQIGVFGADNRPLGPMELVPNAVDPTLAEVVRQAVIDRYEREGAPRPVVIVGNARPQPPKAHDATRSKVR